MKKRKTRVLKAMGSKGLTLDHIRDLAKIQCSAREIAAVLGVKRSDVTNEVQFNPEFAAAWKDGKQEGYVGLRRAMWEKAMDGNTTMQIWLSKQHLGMRDDHRVMVKHIESTAEQYKGMTDDELKAEVERIAEEVTQQVH